MQIYSMIDILCGKLEMKKMTNDTSGIAERRPLEEWLV